MKINTDDVILKETIVVAKGVCILSAISLAISALCGLLDLPLFIGFLIGSAYAIANFYMIGLTVENALDKPPEAAARYMSSQYFVRLILSGLVIFIGMSVDFINFFGIIIPFVFPKLTLFLCTILGKEASR